MSAPNSNTDEIAQRREKAQRTTHLRTSYLSTVDRHGDDVLGRTRPTNRSEREHEKCAARAAWAHLEALGLVGIYPAWITDTDVA